MTDITIINQCFLQIHIILNGQSYVVPPRSSAIFSIYKPKKIRVYFWLRFLSRFNIGTVIQPNVNTLIVKHIFLSKGLSIVAILLSGIAFIIWKKSIPDTQIGIIIFFLVIAFILSMTYVERETK